MPEIPRLGPARVIPLQRVDPRDVGSGVGNVAAGDAAGTLAYAASRIQEAEQAARVAEGVSAVDDQLARLQVDLAENEPDHNAWEAKYQQRKTQLLGEFRKRITGAQFQQAFDLRAGNIADRRGLMVREGVNAKRLDVARGGAITAIDNAYRKAATERDPLLRQGYLDEAQAAGDAVVASGAMTETARAQLMMQHGDQLRASDELAEKAAVLEEIRLDSAAAYRELNNPQGRYAGMDPYTRQVMIGRALEEHSAGLASDRAAYEFNLRQQDRAEERLADEAQRLADEALVAGDMGRLDQILDASRDYMTPEQRRYYLGRKAAGGGLSDTTSTDADTYNELSDLNLNGDPSVRKRAVQAFQLGRITRENRDTLIKDSEDRRFGDPGRFIAQKLEVGEGVESISGRALSAEANAEWSQWKAATPDATPAQAWEKAREIANQFSLLKLDQIQATFRQPKYAVGERGKYDLEATEDATLQAAVARLGLAGAPPEQIEAALRADFDYGREIQNIEQWRDWQTRKTAEDEAKKGARRVQP